MVRASWHPGPASAAILPDLSGALAADYKPASPTQPNPTGPASFHAYGSDGPNTDRFHRGCVDAPGLGGDCESGLLAPRSSGRLGTYGPQQAHIGPTRGSGDPRSSTVVADALAKPLRRGHPALGPRRPTPSQVKATA